MAEQLRRVRLRNDSAANWAESNPVLKRGETVYENDTLPWKSKTGDGITAWNVLPYNSSGGAADALGTVLAGWTGTATAAAIAATDTILGALEKLWAYVSAIWTETTVFSPAIPAGATGFAFRAGRNTTVNGLYIDCQDLAGDAQTPTSFVLTIYINGALAYTSSVITTAATTDTVGLSISAGDRVKVSVSNTTGITGCIVVGMRKVRRAA